MTVFVRRKGSVKPYFYKFQVGNQLIRQYGFKTPAEAKEAEAEERLRLSALASSASFLWMAEKRMEVIAAYSTPLWLTNCKGIIERGFKDWFPIPGGEITTEQVRTRIMQIARKKGNSIANRSLVVVKAVFAQAVKDGLLNRNPAVGVPTLPTTKARKNIPNREDIDKVLQIAKPEQRAYLEAILFTGARVNEINNLRSEDVDFKRCTLKLWTRKKRGGNKRYRVIHMVKRVQEAIAPLIADFSSPWVFNNPEMVRRHPDDPEKWHYVYRDKFLKTLCRDAGVPEFTYHHLRHYTASALAEAGVPLTTIQQILGHESAVTTNQYLQDLGKAATALEVLI